MAYSKSVTLTIASSKSKVNSTLHSMRILDDCFYWSEESELLRGEGRLLSNLWTYTVAPSNVATTTSSALLAAVMKVILVYSN